MLKPRECPRFANVEPVFRLSPPKMAKSESRGSRGIVRNVFMLIG